MKSVTLHNATAWSIQSATLALFALLVVLAADARAITIPMVQVGNPGNAPDTRYNSISIGSIDHVYQIGKYEVTAGQYTEFLNAVAKADPNGLYNSKMGADNLGANILQSGSSPNFSYSVAADWANRPVNFVSFWDAARFANWLHNGQPVGPQGPETTEGGAYLNIGNQTTFARQPGARFFIPTENEWYKAAYHNKSAGLAASYFDYPTGSNSLPGRDITETTNPGNNANYYLLSSGYLIGSPYYRTEVGAFANSASPYGTFDQGGNVHEWNETVYQGSSRSARGGSFSLNSFDMTASDNFGRGVPTLLNGDLGFRVASILLTGDYNGNGIVDAADYTDWRDTLGQAGVGLAADGDGSGVIDAGDYDVWTTNFGNHAGAGATGSATAAVPEPATIVLLLSGAMSLMILRRAIVS